jgi:hypothetical protein
VRGLGQLKRFLNVVRYLSTRLSEKKSTKGTADAIRPGVMTPEDIVFLSEEVRPAGPRLLISD